MAHDFAKRAQKHKRQQASKKKKPGVSKSLAFITLVIASGFVAFLLHLVKFQPGISGQPSALNTPESTEKQDTTLHANIDHSKNPYDFYTLLPESEVIAAKVEAYQSEPKTQNNEPYAYMLQAGSFKNAADADRLRAQLILHGLNVKTRPGKTQSGTWHRVLVGPFSSRSELNRAQDILARANTQSMLIKIKP